MTDEILEDFKKESKDLLCQMQDTLEGVEGDFSRVLELEKFGLYVDRIMGGAKSLAQTSEAESSLLKVGHYAELCKAVGYKASQIQSNEHFFNICIAFLMDATEMLDAMVDALSKKEIHINEILNKTFLERLQWISGQFGQNVRATVESSSEKERRLKQNEIDDLLRKLGIE